MLLRPLFIALAFVAVLGTARAQAIDTVTPAVGSPGQVITIDGSGFLGGGTKAPAVFLRDPATLKKTALAISGAFSDTQLTVVFKKGAAGARDVVVLPKGGAEIVSAGAFEVKLAAFTDVDSGAVPVDHAAPGSTVTANGSFFGTLGGSLYVGAKKCALTGAGWTDGAITFVMPPKLEDGFYSVRIKNGVGTTATSFAIIVTGGTAATHKPDTLGSKVDKSKFKMGTILGLPSIFASFDPAPAPPAPQVPTVTIGATAVNVSPSKNITVNLPFDPGLDSAQPLVAGEPNGSLSYTETVSLFNFTTWDSTTNDDYAVVVLSFTANQFVATFEGTLDRTVGAAGNPQVVLSKGKLRGTLP